MGTNTENGIRIFGKTIRILVLGDHASVGSGDRFSVRILVHHTINLGCGKFGLGFYNLFRIRFLVYVTLFLDHCNSRRRPSICIFEFRSVSVTRETRCQHEGIDSTVKTENSSDRTMW